jgi:plasmid stabilization system protein ParE
VIEFIARDSREGALRVLEQALSAAASLESLSERGRVVPELADPSVREIFVYHYRLVYRVAPESVAILAFVHGARDFERWRHQ